MRCIIFFNNLLNREWIIKCIIIAFLKEIKIYNFFDLNWVIQYFMKNTSTANVTFDNLCMLITGSFNFYYFIIFQRDIIKFSLRFKGLMS